MSVGQPPKLLYFALLHVGMQYSFSMCEGICTEVLIRRSAIHVHKLKGYMLSNVS
jgi:hypothetical protein